MTCERYGWRTGAALLAVGLLVTAGTGCGGGGDDDDATAAESSDTTVAPDEASLEEALLTEADLPGWTEHRDVEWQPAPEDCGGEAAGIAAGVHLELSHDDPTLGDTRGVFQDVIAFDDAEAAADFMAAQRELFATCVGSGTDPNDFTVAGIADLDLGDAELGDDPYGQQVTFGEPNPFGSAVQGMEFVAVRRGARVSLITTFVPLLTQPDAVELAATVYERL